MSKSISRRRFLAEGGKTILTVGTLSGGVGTLLSACGLPATSTTTSSVEVSYTYPTFTPVPDVQLANWYRMRSTRSCKPGTM